MDKQTKSNFMLKGMIESFKERPSSQLFNRIVGIKFKNIRLDKGITAEEVIQDNKLYFHSIYDLYKFEKGIKTDVAKMFALSNYYNYDMNFFWQRFKWKGKTCGKTTH